jgi:hypothetical protein
MICSIAFLLRAFDFYGGDIGSVYPDIEAYRDSVHLYVFMASFSTLSFYDGLCPSL